MDDSFAEYTSNIDLKGHLCLDHSGKVYVILEYLDKYVKLDTTGEVSRLENASDIKYISSLPLPDDHLRILYSYLYSDGRLELKELVKNIILPHAALILTFNNKKVKEFLESSKSFHGGLPTREERLPFSDKQSTVLDVSFSLHEVGIFNTLESCYFRLIELLDKKLNICLIFGKEISIVKGVYKVYSGFSGKEEPLRSLRIEMDTSNYFLENIDSEIQEGITLPYFHPEGKHPKILLLSSGRIIK
jgi:hypothetical protein